MPTWPAAAAPANNVSIAEGLRWLADQVGTAGAGLTAADDAVIAAIPSAATNAAAVWDMDATGHQTQGTFGQAIGDPVADTGTIFKATVTDATGVTVGTDTATLLTRMGTPSNLGGGATLAGNLSDIEGQTDDIGVAGAGLTAADDAVITAIAALNNLSQANVRTAVGLASANLDTQLTTIDDFLDLEVAAIKAKTDNLPAAPAAVGDIPTAAQNATAVWTTAMSDITAVPSMTGTVLAAINWLFALGRNKVTQTATTMVLKKDDGSTTVASSTVSDDGVTYTRGEFS
jgi:hypothetical protein